MNNIPVEELKAIVSPELILLQEPMSARTFFRIGGPADCFVLPRNLEELKQVIVLLREKQVPYFIIGNGSNLLVSDAGYRGVVIKVGTLFSNVRREGDKIIAEAGAPMYKAADLAMRCGLTGLEFASGIPGTVGGGVIMNAGAYNGEMRQVVEEVRYLDAEGKECVLDNAGMKFDYRTSILKGSNCVITEVVFALKPGDQEAIKDYMSDLARRRCEKQPLEYPSAGSTFKRPEGYFAGKLIDDAGLRGYSIGGAQVSEKHCGFIVNKGEATAEDVRRLISYVQAEVKKQFNVELETEVLFLGWE